MAGITFVAKGIDGATKGINGGTKPIDGETEPITALAFDGVKVAVGCEKRCLGSDHGQKTGDDAIDATGSCDAPVAGGGSRRRRRVLNQAHRFVRWLTAGDEALPLLPHLPTAKFILTLSLGNAAQRAK
jgi:hypothetical protein